jgi:glycosyltransferase involved in cell wall biosynthesis
MHICIVDTTITTPPTGGAQTFLVELCQALVRQGWQLSVITQPGPENAIQDSLEHAGATVLDQLWRRADLPEERGKALAAWVNSTRPDVYVVSISPDTGWLALPLLAPTIPTISIAHNDVGAFYAPVAHYAPLIDCAIGVSEETARHLREETGMPAERVRQIPYGVHPLAPPAAERRFANPRRAGAPLRLGYVGRVVTEQKRVLDFLGLARELKVTGVPFELHIIGDGPERIPLAEAFRKDGYREEVKFWGWLPQERIAERLAGLDVFMLLSDYEGLPVALLEAMGHAVAPVITRIPSGNTQLIRDGENGLLFPVGEVATAARHLARLASDPALLERLQRGAWNTAREYSVERMVQRYQDCFREISQTGFSRAHRLDAPRPYPLLPACRSRYPTWLRKLKYRLNASGI